MRKVYAGLFSLLNGEFEAPNEWPPALGEDRAAPLTRILADSAARTTSDLVEARPAGGGALIATYRPP